MGDSGSSTAHAGIFIVLVLEVTAVYGLLPKYSDQFIGFWFSSNSILLQTQPRVVS